MAFDNSFTAVVGATYTAAQYNTHVRDNFTAVWVYTAAGDIAYATSATALARLAKGTAYQTLRMNSGATAPEWGGAIVGKAVRAANQTVNDSTLTAAIFMSAEISHSLVSWSAGSPTRLTIGLTGKYILGASYAIDGGAGYREAGIYKNSAEILPSRIDNAAGETTYLPFGGSSFSLSAGDYLEVFVKHNAGGAINLRAASLSAAFVGV